MIHIPKYDQLFLHCEIPRNCWKKLSISAGGDRKKLRRLSRMLRHFSSTTYRESYDHIPSVPVERFDADTLGELKRSKGSRLVRVGSSASDILRNAKVLASGQELLLGPPTIPTADNYVDLLLPITERSIVLPLPSYSLKVIEKYVKFKRTLPEANGNWSMASYIEATERDDEATREQVMDAIRTYNREDLEAAWEVLKWLLGKQA